MSRIREMRIKNNKTQQEMAELLCINRTTYTKWENGTHAPDIISLKQLAHNFNTTVAYLLGETDNPEKEKPATGEGDGENAFIDLSNTAQNNTEKKLLLMARRAADIPDSEREELIKVLEDTVEAYLKEKRKNK